MGFIINPIAGMGGSVGLKGTDGEAYRLALMRGAKPIAWIRALEFLNNINTNEFRILVGNGEMGLNTVVKSRHRDKITAVIGEYKVETTPEDTKMIASEMAREGIDILVFVGGDGTARDIYEAVGENVVVLGVPSGVKMYSSVFAANPIAAARVFEAFIEGRARIVEREVLDIDEDAFRRDELVIRLYGYLKVPVVEDYIQSSKTPSPTTGSEEENKESIAKYIVENMEDDTLYILGPGTTVKAINKLLGLPYTTLGVDLVVNKKLLVKDAWEKDIIEALKTYGRAKIIITPLGGNGFIFGRGNQQITPRIIRRVGRENILIVSTMSKLMNLKYLLVDTGDREVDKMLEGYYKILVDYNRFVVKKVVSLD